MRRYEYKFAKQDVVLGFSQTQKMEDAEKEWNDLGKEGWKFCKEGSGCIIFIREIP